jgi:hypothetical protein
MTNLLSVADTAVVLGIIFVAVSIAARLTKDIESLGPLPVWRGERRQTRVSHARGSPRMRPLQELKCEQGVELYVVRCT